MTTAGAAIAAIPMNARIRVQSIEARLLSENAPDRDHCDQSQQDVAAYLGHHDNEWRVGLENRSDKEVGWYDTSNAREPLSGLTDQEQRDQESGGRPNDREP